MPASAVSTAADPLLVRAYSASPAPLLKIAHGVSLKVRPKPTCSYGAPLKVAENSTVRAGANSVSVEARAPSMLSAPPDTSMFVAPPPDTADHPAGSAVPSNSARGAGARHRAPAGGALVPSPSLAGAPYPQDLSDPGAKGEKHQGVIPLVRRG